MRRWVAIPVVVVVGLIALLGYSLTRQPRILPSALIGKPAPAFDLSTLASADKQVSSQILKGNVTLVNVWASWCAACRAENALVAKVSQTTGVPVLGINYKDTRSAAKRWLGRFGDPFAVIAFDHSGQVGIDWGVAGVPETFVVDRSGTIRDKVVGPITRKEMNQQLIPELKRLQAAF